MKEKSENILVLLNKTRLRLGLLREFEKEAELIYAARFHDIVAEIKWQELDAIVIDMEDDEIDAIGIIQTINSTCPSVTVIMLCAKRDHMINQILNWLPNAATVLGKTNSAQLADKIRREIKKTRRRRIQPESAGDCIPPVQLEEAYENSIEKLIVALMGINHQAADFQINRSRLSWEYISRIDMFCEDLNQVTKKHAKLEEESEK